MNDRTTAGSRFTMREGTVKKNTNDPPTTDRPPPPNAQVAPPAASNASTPSHSAHPLIDAVALAILAHSNSAHSGFVDAQQEFESISEPSRNNLRIKARAAIATVLRELRQSTPGMRLAAAATPFDSIIGRATYAAIWEAMIDAARKEVGV